MRRLTTLTRLAAGLLALAPALGAAAWATPLAAQKAAAVPERPRLAAGADTNDAAAYYAYGILPDVSWKKAQNAFYWAYRIDPRSTGYILAQWQALWLRQPAEWRMEYREGAEFVLRSRESRQLDSLYRTVMTRDPFTHFTGCFYPEWIRDVRDPLAAGSILYDGGCFKDAAVRLGEALAKRPGLVGVRIDRARALAFSGANGSALAELQTALDTLRARDGTRVGQFYASKEMLEYMMGLLLVEEERYDEARDAFGRALVENLAFYHAHERLAEIALRRRDVGGAIAEFEQALQLEGNDPLLRHDYAVALMNATPRRYADAEVQLRKAIELAPDFPTSYFNLAVALAQQGKRDEAIAHYRQFVSRAPRTAARLVADATKSIAVLESSAAPTGRDR